MPNRFARQFGYDQLYVGNPNARLAFSGNLFEGARAWYYSVAGGTEATFRLPIKGPKGRTSFSFCTWYFQANQTPDFAPEYSCIESINAGYEARSGSTKRSRGVEQYLKALKEVRRGSREEPRAAKARQAVGKRPRGSTSTAEPAPKKVRRDLTAAVSPSEDIPSGVEEPREEEADEDDAPLVPARRLRSRGPRIVEEAEPADKPTTADEAEQFEVDIMSGGDVERPGVSAQFGASSAHERRDEAQQPEVDIMGDVEIPGVSTQPGSSSAHERRDEAQQPGSPSVFISSARTVDPSPTTGVFGGKAPVAEVPRVELSSSLSEEEIDFEDEVDFGDEPAPPDPSKFSHISEEEIYGCEPLTTSPLAAVIPAEAAEGTLLAKLILLTRRRIFDVFFFIWPRVAGLVMVSEAAASS